MRNLGTRCNERLRHQAWRLIDGRVKIRRDRDCNRDATAQVAHRKIRITFVINSRVVATVGAAAVHNSN